MWFCVPLTGRTRQATSFERVGSSLSLACYGTDLGISFLRDISGHTPGEQGIAFLRLRVPLSSVGCISHHALQIVYGCSSSNLH